MKKTIQLTESDLMRIIKRIINEQTQKTYEDFQFKEFLKDNGIKYRMNGTGKKDGYYLCTRIGEFDPEKYVYIKKTFYKVGDVPYNRLMGEINTWMDNYINRQTKLRGSVAQEVKSRFMGEWIKGGMSEKLFRYLVEKFKDLRSNWLLNNTPPFFKP